MINSVKDFRVKIEPPVEKRVLKIERYAQRLTQGYSGYGGSYLWAPGIVCILYFQLKLFYIFLIALEKPSLCVFVIIFSGHNSKFWF